jgi:hypothetical protein
MKPKDGGAVTLAHFFTRIETQANVVVAPDAHGLDFLEEADRLLDPLARLENVSQDDEAFRPVLAQHSDGLLQLPGVLVDVGQNSQLHWGPSISFRCPVAPPSTPRSRSLLPPQPC